MQFPITIGLHRSRFLGIMLLIAGLLACVATLCFQCVLSIRVGLFVAISILVTLAWRALRPAIQTIRLERDGSISIARIGEDDFVGATPKAGATIHRWLTVIQFTAEDGRSATLISTVDTQNTDDFRRLRMFLRWQAKFSALNDDA